MGDNHKSYFVLTDTVVSEIKKGIQSHRFSKQELSHKSKFGGYVYELLKEDKSRVYLCSENGGEAGSTILECYYKEGQPIFAVYRKYVFESKGHEYDSEKPILTFEQANYIVENRTLKKAITKNVKNELWSDEDIPSDVELMNIIKSIQLELAEEKIASP